VATPPVVPSAPAAPDLASEIAVLKAQLTTLTEALKPVPQVTAPQTPAPPAPQPTFVDLLREGKFDEAEKLIIDKATAQIRSTMVPEVLESSVAQNRSIARAEAEIEKFVNQVRTENADLAPFEGYVVYQAEQAMARQRAEGKINSTEDLVKAYKENVLEALKNTRTIAQTFRGAGKQEAMTTRSEVLSTSTVPPNGVDTSRGQVQQTEDQPLKEPTVSDYLAARTAQQNRNKQLVS
jgi:hypothetical protein